MGLEIALPSAALRSRLDSKIITTELGNKAGVPSAPNALGRAKSYAELQQLCKNNKLGNDLVVQTPYGDSGKTTFFIKAEADWNRCKDKLIDQQLKVMKRINHIPYTVEAVATRCGTLVGPIQTDITGYEELTPYKGGWCGNDMFNYVLKKKQKSKVHEMVQAMGDCLYQEGYKGAFCFDFLVDTDTDDVYMGEINPRISGASPLTNLVTSKYGGAPLMMFHLLEFMDVDFEIDIRSIQKRWADFDTWTQLVIKNTDDNVEQIIKAPTSGIWQKEANGALRFLQRSIDWHTVGEEDEVFYMRIHGVGEYFYQGADVGILVTRGRMQTDDRQLTDRAKWWVDALRKQFHTVAPTLEIVPPEAGVRKMF